MTLWAIIALVVLLLLAVLVLFVALRYDEARKRRTKLAQKQKPEASANEKSPTNPPTHS
jgi:cytoskeletal protein RodZ